MGTGGGVDFEEFLLWAVNAYAEEIMDPLERTNRRLSIQYGIDMITIEHVRRIFSAFDTTGDDCIDEEEFRGCLVQLMNIRDPSDISVSKLQLFWREVDKDFSGSVTFEEFAIWYVKFFLQTGSAGSRAGMRAARPAAF
eukprot:NODE_4258_length_692_cov_383.098901.p1 GENE.NODE_4258_length_692_cov_383.098901~~NODE_4258_length_692_cov_383.098901.p1  ORF type:complete len:139 (+),score=50.89 NODE_4258_length_692_cov_383.098901:3-419(+)